MVNREAAKNSVGKRAGLLPLVAHLRIKCTGPSGGGAWRNTCNLLAGTIPAFASLFLLHPPYSKSIQMARQASCCNTSLGTSHKGYFHFAISP